MAKRLLDILVATIGLTVAMPLLAIGMAGIMLTSPGPVFYKARRIGRGSKNFQMLKLRTMHVTQGGATITAPNDLRIFRWGKILRMTKIDEIPQLWNVLIGEMSLVGPRPEDPKIVERHYTSWMRETLSVRPGLTSPGALLIYTHGAYMLDESDPEGSYIKDILAIKLAIDRAYIDREYFFSDIKVIIYTATLIFQMLLGRRTFPLPRDAAAASKWAAMPVSLETRR